MSGLNTEEKMNFSNYFKKGASWANDDKNAGTVEAIGGAVSAAGTLGTAAFESGNTENNLRWGSQGDSARATNEAAVGVVGSVNPVAGLIGGGVNAIGQSIGAALNKTNDYDEFGYNSNEANGGAYYRLGHAFDIAGQAQATLDSGYEGSGFDAGLTALGFGIIGGQRRFNAEQRIAEERRKVSELEEKSSWAQNQYNFTPNLNV